MSSATDIANSALTRMGAAHVSSIDDTENEHARVLKAEYPIVRDKVLRQYRWGFAMKRAALPQDFDTPAFGFDFQYGLPTDFLSLVELGDHHVGLDLSDYRNTDATEYAIEGSFILANLGSPLNIRYVRRVTEVGLFDPHFVDVVAQALAYNTVERITQSSAKKQLLLEGLKLALQDAVRARAIERAPAPVADDTWIIGRLGSA